MFEKLQKWFFWFWVKNYRVSFLFIFLIVISWVYSLVSIPKESSPDIKFGILSVYTIYPWVNPTDIDSLITEKIENEIEDIDWIKKITSTSWVWFSSINIELYNWVNSRDVMTDVKDKIDTVNLPEDAEDPIVTEISSQSDLMFEALIYWPKDRFDDFYLMAKAKKIQSNLEWKAWIVSIDIWWLDSLKWTTAWWWEKDYDINVLISKEKLELLWISLNQVANIIRSYNKNTPIWNYEIWELNYDFRFKWEFANIEELKSLVISNNWSSKITLKDIANIEKSYDLWKINSLGFYDEKWYNYVSLAFNKKWWTNVFSVSGSAKTALEDYIKSNTDLKDLKIKYTKDMSELIIEDYWNLWKTWLQTLLLVFITILFFVWIRESIIASLLLPLSFFITFIVLNLIWFSMNFLTNFSLVLTLWIAIDTIIVIIEWASERQRIGFCRESAILLAIRDLKAPLISGTFTTLSAFLPLMFLPGLMWRFLSYIPITVFSTLLAALILSLTLSSALFVKLSKKKDYYHKEKSLESLMKKDELSLLEENREDKKLKQESSLSFRQRFLDSLWEKYYLVLWRFLHNRKSRIISIFAPVVLLILTFFLLSPRIWFIMFPNTDNSVMTINIEAKTGTSKEYMTKYLDYIDDSVYKYPELKVFYTTVSWNSISVYVELINKLERDDVWMRSIFDIEKLIAEDINKLTSDWLKVEVSVLKEWPPTVKAVWIKLIASDNKKVSTLRDVSLDFEDYLKTIAWTKNVSANSQDNPWQFSFHFDKDKLSFMWLTPNDLLWEIYAYTNGIKAGSIKSYYEDNDIVLKISDFEDKLSPNDINNLVIDTRVWKIRVWDYADYSFDSSLSAINRENGKIIVSVESDLENGVLPSSVQPLLVNYAQDYNYPEWISFESWWENSENMDLIISTIMSFFIALFLIFWILVFQFNSFSQPSMILYSVVLAFIWVNVWLFVTWNPYSMPFAIWFIALTWVVVNDAIILVDTINKNIEKSKLKHKDSIDEKHFFQAIVYAWRSRLQPIIVTTLTTIFWVLPLALQDPFWAGLWFTIIFWLFAWSLMTLFIIPALYFSIWIKKK